MPLITTDSMQFELGSDENLLGALEKTGHGVEYQCRQGYCGSCRVKLLAGRVSYAEMPMAFVLPNEILPCCCRVESDVRIGCAFRQPEQLDE